MDVSTLLNKELLIKFQTSSSVQSLILSQASTYQVTSCVSYFHWLLLAFINMLNGEDYQASVVEAHECLSSRTHVGHAQRAEGQSNT